LLEGGLVSLVRMVGVEWRKGKTLGGGVEEMTIKCDDCGTENLSSAEVCKKCGATLKPRLATVETPVKAEESKLPFIKRIIPRRSQAKKG